MALLETRGTPWIESSENREHKYGEQVGLIRLHPFLIFSASLSGIQFSIAIMEVLISTELSRVYRTNREECNLIEASFLFYPGEIFVMQREAFKCDRNSGSGNSRNNLIILKAERGDIIIFAGRFFSSQLTYCKWQIKLNL